VFFDRVPGDSLEPLTVALQSVCEKLVEQGTILASSGQS